MRRMNSTKTDRIRCGVPIYVDRPQVFERGAGRSRRTHLTSLNPPTMPLVDNSTCHS